MAEKENQWDRVIQAMLDVADVADELGYYDQADVIAGLLPKATLVRTAQYEGPQNYFILNQRAFERAWRIKREKKGLSQQVPMSPEETPEFFNSAQECWLDVLEEYQDALFGKDAEMLSKYAAKEWKAPTTKRKLSTKAVTRNKHGETNEYDVEILEDESGKEILAITGTPGQWYVDTLKGEDKWSSHQGAIPSSVAIDFGQNWVWTNVKEVLEEVDSESKPEPGVETGSQGGGGSGAIMSGNMTEFHKKMEAEAKAQGVSYGEYIAKKFGPKGVEAGRAILAKTSERISEGSPPGVAFYEAMDHFLSGSMAREIIATALASAKKVAFSIEEGEEIDRDVKIDELEKMFQAFGRALSVLEEELENLKVWKSALPRDVDIPKHMKQLEE